MARKKKLKSHGVRYVQRFIHFRSLSISNSSISRAMEEGELFTSMEDGEQSSVPPQAGYQVQV